MDSPLLILLSLGVFFSFFAPFVISQQNVNPEPTPSPPPPVFSPPPPPPDIPPPPPPPMSPPPPPPPRPRFRPPQMRIPRRRPPPPPPPVPEDKNHAGVVVGVIFLCIAFLMQIGVVTYLLNKRRQLLKD